MTLAQAAAGAPPTKSRTAAFLGLAVGSAGVVYGDIGTSPLYAFKESVSHVRGAGALATSDVVGVVSLMLWSLMVVVTLKYILLLMRFDNRGEGGTLSLMALVQKASGKTGGWVALVGMIGAGLFFGDAMLTPAVSVLSAVEGLSVVEGLQGRLDGWTAPLALAILVALFVVQRHGTGGVGRWFGPICLVWFVVLAVLGLLQLVQAPQMLAAFNPIAGLSVFVRHPMLAPLILGSVFLTVTGAEALYADMGHFGRKPIQAAWMGLVFPALILNYLGQGALVLRQPEAAASPFFLMAPDWFQLPLVLLATAATVIASQAVISGAFSLTQQAVQLGLLPRMTLKPTSEHHEGQIYAPEVNWILMLGVGALVLGFGSSSALASAYGISVVGAMITSTILAVVAMRRVRGRSLAVSLLVFCPFLVVETGFLAANLTKVAHGGYVPLLIAATLVAVMGCWLRGQRKLARGGDGDIGVTDVVELLRTRPPMRAKGLAVFLTADPERAPAALLHNIKHNQVLHERVVLLTVEMAHRPRVPAAERTCVRELAPDISGVTLHYGFMESPNVPEALAQVPGIGFDLMRTSFFLSRRTLSFRSGGLARLLDLVFAFQMRNAARAADVFGLPPSRVVELGAQVVL